jgi:hypothetical protein
MVPERCLLSHARSAVRTRLGLRARNERNFEEAFASAARLRAGVSVSLRCSIGGQKTRQLVGYHPEFEPDRKDGRGKLTP